jgi:hypothetical protein
MWCVEPKNVRPHTPFTSFVIPELSKIAPYSVIARLMHFRIWLRIREVIRQSWSLSSVIDTAQAS